MTLSLLDAQEHARRIDVLDAEAADLAETNAGRIEDREQNAITQRADGCQKRDQFVDRKNDWKVTFAPAIGNAHDQVGTIHHVEIEEAESADALIEPAVRDLPCVAEEEQVLLDLGKPERSGRAVEVQGEAGNEVDVDAFSTRGHVADA
jgi:hypothetical protein